MSEEQLIIVGLPAFYHIQNACFFKPRKHEQQKSFFIIELTVYQIVLTVYVKEGIKVTKWNKTVEY